MSLIEWRDDFSVGVAAIDHEHRALIALVNELYQHLSEGKRSADPEGAMGDLYAHISAHFALEETLMRERRYARYLPHKEDHDRLLEEIREMMDLLQGGVREADEHAFGERLAAWFSHHFRNEDALLHRCIGGG